MSGWGKPPSRGSLRASCGSMQIGDSVVLMSSRRVRDMLCRGVDGTTCVLPDTFFLLDFSAISSICFAARSSFSSGTRFWAANSIADPAEKVGARAGRVADMCAVAHICRKILLGVDAVTSIDDGFFLSIWQICWGL